MDALLIRELLNGINNELEKHYRNGYNAENYELVDELENEAMWHRAQLKRMGEVV